MSLSDQKKDHCAAELGDADSAIGIGTAVTDESRWRPVWQRPSLLLGYRHAGQQRFRGGFYRL